MQKPNWWPKNPYPESVFPMPEERYPEIVPDPDLRTALSGMLGRRFWNIASEMIWAAMYEAIEEIVEQGTVPDMAVSSLIEIKGDDPKEVTQEMEWE